MKNLSIAFFNVRSLCSSFADVKEIISRENFDLVGLVETWLTHNVSNENISIDGYNIVRADRGARGGGVAIYYKSHLKIGVIDIPSLEVLEQKWVSVHICKQKYIIGTVYRPPNKDIEQFLNEFEDSLSFVTPLCDGIICGGDINIDMLDICSNRSILFNNLIESFNLTQIIKGATRVTRDSATLLDIILINEYLEDDIIATNILDVPDISDHALTFCKLKTEIEEKVEKITFRNLKRLDFVTLEYLLSLTPFQNVFWLDDVNEKVRYINELILNIFDTVAPEKTIYMKHKNPPWLTDNVKFLIKLRDKALSKYKRSKNNNHWNYYKSLRNQVTTAIRNEKKAFLNFSLNNSFGKELWNKLNLLNIHSKSRETLPEALNYPEDINTYFLNNTGYAVQADRDILNFYANNRKLQFDRLFKFESISENTVYETLLEIKTKATGFDKINIDMLLLCCPVIIPYLCHILNCCIEKNVFPDDWKIARIIPLPKKRNASSLDELRPISILPTLSKVFEKVICAQLKEHLENFGILPVHQSGFRAGYSCTTALLEVADNILKEIDGGRSSVLILLDYSKAFDTINHEIMSALLHFIGCSNDSIALLSSYLNDRYQYVETNKGKSAINRIYRGIPQGSIIGPLLFCIYTCQLTNDLNNVKVHQYADDTQLLYSFIPEKVNEASYAINQDLKELMRQSEVHQLTVNPTKSVALIFGKKIIPWKEIYC